MTAALTYTNPNPEPKPTQGIAPSDLAELIATFNDVTGKLEVTHQSLRAEVGRLSAELTETKQQLRRAQELAALGEMAAGIAHEVRNPLGPIRLFAEALVDDLKDRPEQRDIAGRIVNSVTKLNAVVTDVLAFSRELKLHGTNEPLAEIVADAVMQATPIAHERGIAIEVDSARVAHARVNADAALLTQALANVLRNACEAAAESDQSDRLVTITATPATLRAPDNARQHAIAIAVTDTGAGIPDEVKQRIFNPFFTTRETGTGLGLPIVHRIIDAHQGRVEINNTTDNRGNTTGATVTLVVPAPAPAESESHSSHDHRPQAETPDHRRNAS